VTLRRAGLFLILWMLLLSGCAKPVPELRPDYVGHWQGENVTLSISANGMLAYKRNSKGVKTEINAPIAGYKGDDIVVGVWFLTTTFVVSEAPHPVSGYWQMVVDGIRLTRIDSEPDSQPAPAQQKFTCSSCLPSHAV